MTEATTLMPMNKFRTYVIDKATSIAPLAELELENFDDDELVWAHIEIKSGILIVKEVKKMRTPEDWVFFG